MGFGAMQLPGSGVFGPPADRDNALAVLRRAIDLGVNHIDTAQYYGPNVSNELIREALYPYPADLVLVSKVGGRRDEQGGWMPAQSPEELRAGVEENLRTLGIDQIGVVNLRVMSESTGELFDAQVATMMDMRDEGLIGGIGLSNVSLEQFERGRSMTEIACVQNSFNIFDRTSEPVLRACEAAGVAFVPFFPLGSAFPGMKKVADDPGVVAAAARLNITPGQVGLAWLLAFSPNILLIPGTSSLAHLEENMAAANATLDDEALTLGPSD
jgi:aryl-alcohol dehydrogenase-like predicted oxidoreductase